MKIAVTAANGQLGSSIVNELKNEIGKAIRLGIEIRKGDYNSRDDFNAALKSIDRVMLISGMYAPQKEFSNTGT